MLRARPHPSPGASVLWLALICGTVVSQLGGRGLNEPDEGRYTEIAREMIATGDWMVPRLESVPHVAKPPLTYWLVAICALVFGFDEWALRLPVALAALMTLWLVYDLGRRQYDRFVGLLAAAVLATTLGFFIIGRVVTTDMLLTVQVTLAYWAAWIVIQDPGGTRRTGHLAAFWIALGTGFMTKGPVPLAIVFSSLAGLALLDQSGKWRLRRLLSWWGPLLMAAIALPWYLMMVPRIDGLLEYWIGHEVLARVTDGVGREKPFWFFVAVLPVVAWPWTLIAGQAIARAIRRRHDPRTTLALAAVLLPFLVFSVARSKLPAYMIPLLAPLALLTARLMATWWAGARTAPSRGLWLVTWGLTAASGLTGLRADGRPEGYLGFACGAAALTLGLVINLRHRPAPARLQIPALIITTAALLQITAFIAAKAETDLSSNSSWRVLADAARPFDPVGAEIGDWRRPEAALTWPPGTRIAAFDRRFVSASVYLFGDRAEYLPRFDGESVWEIPRWQARERRRHLDDLIALAKDSNEILIFTKRRHIEMLKQRLPGEVRVVKEAGQGSRAGVLIHCRRR